MEENNLTKNQFCDLCKISIKDFDKIFAMDMDFGLKTLVKIAKLFDMNIAELLVVNPFRKNKNIKKM